MSIISTLLSNLNYGTIFFLMLLESTVIPVPSELVVAPAAYHSAAGNLDIWLVILFSTLGADAGASINYLAGWLLGRPVIWRFADSKLGKLCMLSHEKIEKSEAYFNNHGMVATITGRLIPGIRHLISIPAGLAKMHYWKFMLYTTIGAGAWNCILAAMGWYLHTIVPEDQLHDKILEYGEYTKLVIVALVVIAIAYFTIKWFMKRKSNKAQ